MHSGCSGKFDDGKQIADKLRMMGFSDGLMLFLQNLIVNVVWNLLWILLNLHALVVEWFTPLLPVMLLM